MTSSMHLPAALRAAFAGRYQIVRPIGRGGMGIVYVANDLKHQRRVAIKVLHAESAGGIDTARFLQEIRIVAKLQHPHILSLHDSGEVAGTLYYVMPFVAGGSLRDQLERERQLPLQEGLRITHEVASALHHAHRVGVIHRDVKPGNILLSHGQAMLADFGIARDLSPSASTGLSRTGVTPGTALYASPEQMSTDQPVDARSDIYSLSCVLYEMIAGEPPFPGKTLQAVFARKIRGTVSPLSDLRETVPPWLNEVIAKALAKAPADRFATAREFAEAVSPELLGNHLKSRQRRRPNLLHLAIVAALALTAAATLYFGGRGESVPQLDQRTSPLIVVLPFAEPEGPESSYFADGITEAIITRLAGLSGLDVIGFASVVRYREMDKSFDEARVDFGVDYLLTGVVQRESATDGVDRVRISVQLIAANGTVTWAREYREDLAGLIEVQSRIAQRVAEALDVVLPENERDRLTFSPTRSREAYDHYLQGNSLYFRSRTREDNLLAVERYEAALALDPSFAEASAALAEAYAVSFQMGGDVQHLEKSRAAVEIALQLEPRTAATNRALGVYHYVRGDYAQAIGPLRDALYYRPGDAEALRISALVARRQGSWREALRNLEKSASLDPYHRPASTSLADTYLYLGDYEAADDRFDRAIQLDPHISEEYLDKAWLAIQRGSSLAEAESVLHDAAELLGMSEILSEAVAQHPRRLWFGMLSHAFDDRLDELSLATLSADSVAYYLSRATSSMARERAQQAFVYYDSARVVAKRRADARPNDATAHSLLGVAYAGTGLNDLAILEGRRGAALSSLDSDAFSGPHHLLHLAHIMLVVGEYEEALTHLDTLLRIPSPYSARWLRLHPIWEPVRALAGFQEVVTRNLTRSFN